MAKLPAFQFYPGDWRKDPELSRASKAEKGMLIDLLCLMHEAEERGTLSTSREPWPDEDIAIAVGGDVAINLGLLQGLLRKGILRRNSSGAVSSTRMVRDEQQRQQAQKDGLKGGNPALTRGGVKGGEKGEDKPKPTPSSSFSSSSSTASSEPKDSPATAVGRLQEAFRKGLETAEGPEAKFNFGQMGGIFKRRLKDTPEIEILVRILNWFASTDPWVIRNRNMPGVFDQKFHQLKGGPIHATSNSKRPENSFRSHADNRRDAGKDGVTL